MMRRPDPILDRISVLESLNTEHFTPEELATLLGVSTDVVRQAVRRRELEAFTVDHRILDIRRDDALEWLNARFSE